jgi:hypothetical protein
VNVSAILPIGRAAETPKRPVKAAMADITHYDRFGNKKQ